MKKSALLIIQRNSISPIQMTMGFQLLLLLIVASHLQCGDSRTILTIRDFISDPNATNVHHSQAFQDAWKAICGGKGDALVVHANETYTIRPQVFQGPCVSRNLLIQIDGKIEAPGVVRDWGNVECWLCFDKVTGLVLTGSGTLHSHGEIWWLSGLGSRPQALKFNSCQNISYSGLTQINGPKNHISVCGCTNVTISNFHVTTPQHSPNTDGIDISRSHNIQILQSSIKTGDDCIAIHRGSYDINITSVACGPGHGISVGSLGEGGATETVQNINVRHCTFTGTQNAARIKTWPGGRGFVKNILYENITLINSRSPIKIDQHYSDLNQAAAVKVSDVTFRSFRGTSADAVAIFIDCDQKTGCDNILLEHIEMTSSSRGKHLTAYCKFANVTKNFVPIPINCVNRRRHKTSPPAPAPAPAPYAMSPTPLPAPAPAPYAMSLTPLPAPAPYAMSPTPLPPPTG